MASDNLPKKLRIGAHDYQVGLMNRADSDAAPGGGGMGLCQTGHLRILIDPGWPQTNVAETLLHEILHACYREWRLCDEDKEERIVDTMAGALICAMRDNPDAFRLILETVAD